MSQSYTTLSSGLTTIFTPPASCTSCWTYEAEGFNSVSGGLLMQNVLTRFDTSCWPPNFSGNGRENGNSDAPVQIYSPGVCPSGYTTAGGFTQSGTTTAICCLQNYAFFTDFSSQFSRTNLFEGCISTYPLASGSTVVEGRVGFGGLSSTTVTGPLTMWAQPLWVEFQEKDLSLLPATTTTTTTTTSSTSQLSASSTAKPSMTKSQPSPSTATSSPTPSTLPNKGLSTGALAGIGVGAALGALLVLAIALFFCLRRRKKSSSSAARIRSDFDGQKGELDAMEPLRKPYSSATVHGPLSAWQNNELEGSEAARELAGSNVDRSSKGLARKPVAGTRVELE